MENELAIWRRARRGDRQAIDELHRLYMPTARKIAVSLARGRKCADYNLAIEAAYAGLSEGIDRYEHMRGSAPLTYLRSVITGYVLHSFRAVGGSPMSRPAFERNRIYMRNLMRLRAELGREPTEAEVEAAAGQKPGRHRKDMLTLAVAGASSLDELLDNSNKPYRNNQGVIADDAVDVAAVAVSGVSREEIWRTVQQIDDKRARAAIEYYYRDDMTQAEVAQAMSADEGRTISQMAVHRALKRGREQLAGPLANYV
jgi:RNA polymerase sigma factor (sigma-70 family)